jgi:hypothetical protein
VRFIIWCLLASSKEFKTTPSYKSNLKKITWICRAIFSISIFLRCSSLGP